MLEVKDYYAVDMVFPFVVAFMDSAAQYTDEIRITTDNHTGDSDLLMFSPPPWRFRTSRFGCGLKRYSII